MANRAAARAGRISDVIGVYDADGTMASIELTIRGEPRVQNGWKVHHIGLKAPCVCDQNAREKIALRRAIVEALAADGLTTVPLFPSHKLLSVRLVFQLGTGVDNKDVDNMSKFLFDTLEDAIYANNKKIVQLEVVKQRNVVGRTIVMVEACPEGPEVIVIDD